MSARRRSPVSVTVTDATSVRIDTLASDLALRMRPRTSAATASGEGTPSAPVASPTTARSGPEVGHDARWIEPVPKPATEPSPSWHHDHTSSVT